MFVWLRNVASNRTFKIICGSEGVGDTMSNSTQEAFSINSLIGEQRQRIVQPLTGGEHTLVSQTIDVWTGTQKRSVMVELVFVALSDTYTEVFLPIRTIQRWSTPSGGKRINPEIKNKKYNIGIFNMNPPPVVHLKIGHSINHPLVEIRQGMITTCTPTWRAPFDEKGYPISAELQITVNDLQIQNAMTIYPEGSDMEDHIIQSVASDIPVSARPNKQSQTSSEETQTRVLSAGETMTRYKSMQTIKVYER